MSDQKQDVSRRERDLSEYNKVMESWFETLKKSVYTVVSHSKDAELRKKFEEESMSFMELYGKIGCRTENLFGCVTKVEIKVNKKFEKDETSDDESEDKEEHEEISEEESDIDEDNLVGIEELGAKIIKKENDGGSDLEETQNNGDEDIAMSGNAEDSELSRKLDLDESYFKDMYRRESAKLEEPDYKYYRYYEHYHRHITDILTAENALLIQASDNITDPISKLPIKNPVKNTICGHTYDKDSVKQYFGNKKSVACPYVGCSCDKFTLNNLVENTQLALKLKENDAKCDTRDINIDDKSEVDTAELSDEEEIL